MFDAYRQADSGITRSFGGTGLGLSIAHKLTLAMGGELSVSSAGKGQGTTMTVTIPFEFTSKQWSRNDETMVMAPLNEQHANSPGDGDGDKGGDGAEGAESVHDAAAAIVNSDDHIGIMGATRLAEAYRRNGQPKMRSDLRILLIDSNEAMLDMLQCACEPLICDARGQVTLCNDPEKAAKMLQRRSGNIKSHYNRQPYDICVLGLSPITDPDTSVAHNTDQLIMFILQYCAEMALPVLVLIPTGKLGYIRAKLHETSTKHSKHGKETHETSKVLRPPRGSHSTSLWRRRVLLKPVEAHRLQRYIARMTAEGHGDSDGSDGSSSPTVETAVSSSAILKDTAIKRESNLSNVRVLVIDGEISRPPRYRQSHLHLHHHPHLHLNYATPFPPPSNLMESILSVLFMVLDNAVNCKILKRVLQLDGYSPTCVLSGKEGLEVLRRHNFSPGFKNSTRFGTIITDIQMPDMDG